MKLLAPSVLGALALATTGAHAATTQFDRFFPAWNGIIQAVLSDKCASELEFYKTGTYDPKGAKSQLITPVIACILGEFPEYRKSEMGAAAVVLGLMPTILQGLGSSTAETSLLGLRRPLLSLLLAAGSPTVAIVRSSELAGTVARFVEGGDTRQSLVPAFRFGRVPAYLRGFIPVVQYLLVGGAVANIIILSYELSAHAVVVFAPETTFLVPLWTFVAVIIHFGGLLALLLRVRIVGGESRKLRRRGTGFATWLPDELIPSAYQPPRQLSWRQGTGDGVFLPDVLFPLLVYIISIGTVIHVVLGTLVLSSLLFYSVVDALNITIRYVASTLVCRGVLRFELLGMNEATKYLGHEEAIEGLREETVELTGGINKPVAVARHEADHEIS